MLGEVLCMYSGRAIRDRACRSQGDDQGLSQILAVCLIGSLMEYSIRSF